jgi:hypothetical protein
VSRIGKPLAIHAAQAFPVVDQRLDAVCRRVFGWGYRTRLPRGALLGYGTLAACHETERVWTTEDDFLAGNFGPGRFAYELTDVMQLHNPFPMHGRQSWFYVDWDGRWAISAVKQVRTPRSAVTAFT